MITIDYETRSRCDLQKCGAWVYAAHPSTTLLCLAYNLTGDKKDTKLWTPWDFDLPEDLYAALRAGEPVEAHNAGFEMALWSSIMIPKFGAPIVELEQWYCSAAKAAMYALPTSLEKSGSALGVSEQKDKEGHRIMMRLCKPKAPSKNHPSVWDNDPEKFNKLYAYCIQDVNTEMCISDALPEMPKSERRVWLLDQRMNQRGFKTDPEVAKIILVHIAEYSKKLTKELEVISEGRMYSINQHVVLRKELIAAGVDIPDTQATTVAKWLKKDLPDYPRRLLEIRKALGKASTAKYEAIVNMTNADGRSRDGLRYHGASTGRWAGRGIQPHNIPRGTLKNKDKSDKSVAADRALVDIANGMTIEDIEKEYGPPLAVFSSCLRGAIIQAPKGKDLIVADYAAIEARVVAWLADEQEALDVFASGECMYCDMASTIYGHKVTKAEHPDKRAVGKTAVLGLGYQMGAKRFNDQCDEFGIPMTIELAEQIVDKYRKRFSKIKAMWNKTEAAAIKAVRSGKPVANHKTIWNMTQCKRFLTCQLPSGRRIFYPYPKLKMTTTSWGAEKMSLTYMTVEKGQWVRRTSYGGMLVENKTQAVARDLMASAMLKIDDHGKYDLILTVHDEEIAEVDEGEGDLKEFETLMAHTPVWAQGCPVAAEGWIGKRYRKD